MWWFFSIESATKFVYFIHICKENAGILPVIFYNSILECLINELYRAIWSARSVGANTTQRELTLAYKGTIVGHIPKAVHP